MLPDSVTLFLLIVTVFVTVPLIFPRPDDPMIENLTTTEEV